MKVLSESRLVKKCLAWSERLIDFWVMWDDEEAVVGPQFKEVNLTVWDEWENSLLASILLLSFLKVNFRLIMVKGLVKSTEAHAAQEYFRKEYNCSKWVNQGIKSTCRFALGSAEFVSRWYRDWDSCQNLVGQMWQFSKRGEVRVEVGHRLNSHKWRHWSWSTNFHIPEWDV